MKSIVEFGAIPDGKTNNAEAIQKTIDSVSEAGGGRVVVPAGEFLSGSICLRRNVELHLESGAVLVASGNYDDYSAEHSTENLTNGLFFEEVLPRRAFIVGFQAYGASITGFGTISGNADEFIAEQGEYIHSMRAPEGGRSQYLERPFTVFLIDCGAVVLKDFTLKDPAFWAIRLTGCDGTAIDGIRILTDLKVPNADGIDIDRCDNVRITNCEIITADDCISLKTCAATAMYGGIKNVIISNCIMTSTSGAITLGTESCADIEQVIISDCVITDSHRGIAIRPREGGQVREVLVTDCIVQTRTFSDMWWGHGEPLHVTAAAWDDETETNPGNVERKLPGTVKNIHFRNISCKAEAGILVWGQQPHMVQDVTFDRVKIEMSAQSKWPSRIDLRPAGATTFLNRDHSAFEIMQAENISLIECKVTWNPVTAHRYAHAVFAESVKSLHIRDFVGEAAKGQLSAVKEI